MDRPSRVSTSQIDPTTVTPYPCPCYVTFPTTQNRTTSGEPPPRSPAACSSLRANRCFPLSVTSFRSPSLAGGPAPMVSSPHPPASFPQSWAAWAYSPARPGALLGRTPPPPPTHLARNDFSFFFFSPFFLFSYIYTHVDILCIKNSPNFL
jgi:hypothetical protein